MTDTSSNISTTCLHAAGEVEPEAAETQLELMSDMPQTEPKPSCAAIGDINPRELKDQTRREHNEQTVMAGI